MHADVWSGCRNGVAASRMANPSLYASREGALYQSYDNFAGGAGLYDPSQNASDSAPQPPAGVAPMASPPHSPLR